MNIKKLDYDFSVCKVTDYSQIDLTSSGEYYFIGKTEQENSLVCPSDKVPDNTTECDSGWKAFRIDETLDFSLIGILAKISSLLADNNIGIFAVSTYNTDYVFVKKENFDKALKILSENDYNVI